MLSVAAGAHGEHVAAAFYHQPRVVLPTVAARELRAAAVVRNRGEHVAAVVGGKHAKLYDALVVRVGIVDGDKTAFVVRRSSMRVKSRYSRKKT